MSDQTNNNHIIFRWGLKGPNALTKQELLKFADQLIVNADILKDIANNDNPVEIRTEGMWSIRMEIIGGNNE